MSSFRRFSSRLRKGAVYTLLALAGAMLLIMVLNVMPPIHDPTEGMFAVNVVNDTPQPAVISLCLNDRCSSLDGPTRIASGDYFEQNINSGVVEKLIVDEEGTGGRSTCRLLQGAALHPKQRVPVTSLPTCKELIHASPHRPAYG